MELLIRAHDAFSLGCCVDGIADVLSLAQQWVTKLMTGQEYSLMVTEPHFSHFNQKLQSLRIVTTVVTELVQTLVNIPYSALFSRHLIFVVFAELLTSTKIIQRKLFDQLAS